MLLIYSLLILVPHLCFFASFASWFGDTRASFLVLCWARCSCLVSRYVNTAPYYRHSSFKLIQLLPARKTGDSKPKSSKTFRKTLLVPLQSGHSFPQVKAQLLTSEWQYSRSPFSPWTQRCLTRITLQQLIFQLEVLLDRLLWDIKAKKRLHKHIRSKNNKTQSGLLFKEEHVKCHFFLHKVNSYLPGSVRLQEDWSEDDLGYSVYPVTV